VRSVPLTTTMEGTVLGPMRSRVVQYRDRAHSAVISNVQGLLFRSGGDDLPDGDAAFGAPSECTEAHATALKLVDVLLRPRVLDAPSPADGVRRPIAKRQRLHLRAEPPYHRLARMSRPIA
jgi:hypothetical protein